MRTFDFEIPSRIKKLPVNKDGYPVPWFVAWIDGVPDFRVIGEDKIRDAIRFHKCWVCGEQLGVRHAFVIGPMCAINRTSSEPPSHKECAIFSAKACPFLSNPERPRRENHMPPGYKEPAGIPIARNPGVALVWITDRYTLMRVYPGILFTIGDPIETLWFARGREATKEEVLHSINTGMPLLKDAASKDGAEALQELNRRKNQALKLVPKA